MTQSASRRMKKEKLAKNSVFGQYADIARGAVAGVLAVCQY